MRQFIDKVTITGADDSIDPKDLVVLSKEFPFVEWGILLSKSSVGKKRFPSYNWLKKLYKVWETDKIVISGHICGSWVRDICIGKWSILKDLKFEDNPNFVDIFERFQLNFHAIVHDLEPYKFVDAIEDAGLSVGGALEKQLIFQLDDVNNGILDIARKNCIDAVALFDTSGGVGVLPDSWPKARDFYCGYAGGLSPENLTAQLEMISEVAGDGPVWIDVETKIRSNEDYQFDLDKVRKFLELSKPWVTNGI
jgi:hypothetical protein